MALTSVYTPRSIPVAVLRAGNASQTVRVRPHSGLGRPETVSGGQEIFYIYDIYCAQVHGSASPREFYRALKEVVSAAA